MNKISIDVQMLIGFFQLMEEDKYYIDLENRLLVNVSTASITNKEDSILIIFKNGAIVYLDKGLDYYQVDLRMSNKRFILDPTETYHTKMSLDRIFWYLDNIMKL